MNSFTFVCWSVGNFSNFIISNECWLPLAWCIQNIFSAPLRWMRGKNCVCSSRKTNKFAFHFFLCNPKSLPVFKIKRERKKCAFVFSLVNLIDAIHYILPLRNFHGVCKSDENRFENTDIIKMSVLATIQQTMHVLIKCVMTLMTNGKRTYRRHMCFMCVWVKWNWFCPKRLQRWCHLANYNYLVVSLIKSAFNRFLMCTVFTSSEIRMYVASVNKFLLTFAWMCIGFG